MSVAPAGSWDRRCCSLVLPCRRSQPLQPPVELDAIAEAILGGEECEVVNALVFVATGSMRHHRRSQLPPPPVRAAPAAAAAQGRGFGHLVLARVGLEWCGRSVFGPCLLVLVLMLLISARISSVAALNCLRFSLRFSSNSTLTAAIGASNRIALNCISLSYGATQTL